MFGLVSDHRRVIFTWIHLLLRFERPHTSSQRRRTSGFDLEAETFGRPGLGGLGIGAIAQSVERVLCKHEAAGSTPAGSTR